MDMSSLDYGNKILQEYSANTSTESSTFLIILINVLLFGSVIIFVGVFVLNFIKAYKGEEPVSFNFGKKEKNTETKSMKSKFNEIKSKTNSMRDSLKPKSNICNVCGEANESDAKFCKNCGTRL